jgi:cytochrome c-type biogenesis protein CcmH
MKRVSTALVLVSLLWASAATPAHAAAQAQDRPAAASDTVTDPDQVARARAINMRLRCPVCAGSSIEESPAFQAEEMKAVVREQVAAGRSDREIEEFFVSKYGDWILLAPPARGLNLLVYVLPVMLVLGGGFFVYRTARKWTQA